MSVCCVWCRNEQNTAQKPATTAIQQLLPQIQKQLMPPPPPPQQGAPGLYFSAMTTGVCFASTNLDCFQWHRISVFSGYTIKCLSGQWFAASSDRERVIGVYLWLYFWQLLHNWVKRFISIETDYTRTFSGWYLELEVSHGGLQINPQNSLWILLDLIQRQFEEGKKSICITSSH